MEENIIVLDGIPIKLKPIDLDQDGEVGGIETVEQQFNDIVPIEDKSETAEVIDTLNKDELDTKTRMSTIDFNSRIQELQLTPMVSLDALIALKFLPIHIGGINRTLMRKAVSLNGEGRKEVVNINQGRKQQEEDKKLRFVDRLKRFVGGKKNENKANQSD